MKSVYWFRSDLRINDNLALNKAIDNSKHILFIYIDDENNYRQTSWEFLRMGEHRKIFINQGISNLDKILKNYGHSLHLLKGNTIEILKKITQEHFIDTVFCEEIYASEEKKQIESLKNLGINVNLTFQSSLFNLEQLPFDLNDMPNVFTKFRKLIEQNQIKPNSPNRLSENILSLIHI